MSSSSACQEATRFVPQDVAAVFHVSFHPTKGNIVDWLLTAPGWEDLTTDALSLEFSALPSGLHQVDEDVVYFTSVLRSSESSPSPSHLSAFAPPDPPAPLLHAISLFRRRRTSNPAWRGFLLGALGVLVVPSCPDPSRTMQPKPRPWRHLDSLADLIERCYSRPGSDPSALPTPSTSNEPLIDFTSDPATPPATAISSEEWYAPAQSFLDSRAVAGLTRAQYIESTKHVPTAACSEVDDLRTEVAASLSAQPPLTLPPHLAALPSLLTQLGPGTIPLFKHVFARKRILFYTRPPVGGVSGYVWGAAGLVSMGHHSAAHNSELRDAFGSEAGNARLKPRHAAPMRMLGMLTLHDLIDDVKRAILEDVDGELGGGWVAYTTDALFLERPQYYDLLIDLTASPAGASSISPLASLSTNYATPTLASSSAGSAFYEAKPLSSEDMAKASSSSSATTAKPRPTMYISKLVSGGPSNTGRGISHVKPVYKLSPTKWAWSDARLWTEVERVLRGPPFDAIYDPYADDGQYIGVQQQGELGAAHGTRDNTSGGAVSSGVEPTGSTGGSGKRRRASWRMTTSGYQSSSSSSAASDGHKRSKRSSKDGGGGGGGEKSHSRTRSLGGHSRSASSEVHSRAGHSRTRSSHTTGPPPSSFHYTADGTTTTWSSMDNNNLGLDSFDSEAGAAAAGSIIPTSIADAWKVYEDVCLVCAGAWMGALAARAGASSGGVVAAADSAGAPGLARTSTALPPLGRASTSTSTSAARTSMSAVPAKRGSTSGGGGGGGDRTRTLPPRNQTLDLGSGSAETSAVLVDLGDQASSPTPATTTTTTTPLSTTTPPPPVCTCSGKHHHHHHPDNTTTSSQKSSNNSSVPTNIIIIIDPSQVDAHLDVPARTALAVLRVFDRYAAWQVGVLHAYVRSILPPAPAPAAAAVDGAGAGAAGSPVPFSSSSSSSSSGAAISLPADEPSLGTTSPSTATGAGTGISSKGAGISSKGAGMSSKGAGMSSSSKGIQGGKLTLTLAPRDMVLLDLNPLSAGDVRHLEALVREYASACVVVVKVVQVDADQAPQAQLAAQLGGFATPAAAAAVVARRSDVIVHQGAGAADGSIKSSGSSSSNAGATTLNGRGSGGARTAVSNSEGSSTSDSAHEQDALLPQVAFTKSKTSSKPGKGKGRVWADSEEGRKEPSGGGGEEEGDDAAAATLRSKKSSRWSLASPKLRTKASRRRGEESESLGPTLTRTHTHSVDLVVKRGWKDLVAVVLGIV